MNSHYAKNYPVGGKDSQQNLIPTCPSKLSKHMIHHRYPLRERSQTEVEGLPLFHDDCDLSDDDDINDKDYSETGDFDDSNSTHSSSGYSHQGVRWVYTEDWRKQRNDVRYAKAEQAKSMNMVRDVLCCLLPIVALLVVSAIRQEFT